MIELKYLITGTGRCGTVYMARLLTHLGVPCGHEAIFDCHGLERAKKRLNGEVTPRLSYCSTAKMEKGEWRNLPVWLPNVLAIQAESSYMAAPFLKDECLGGCRVIHVVRHPVRVVISFCNYIEYFQSREPLNCYEQFIYAQLPELTKEMPTHDRACLFYVLWNEMIESASPSFFYRVEDNPQGLTEKIDLYGSILIEKDINSLKKPCRDMFQLAKVESREIAQRFVDQGRRYGYTMDSQHLLI